MRKKVIIWGKSAEYDAFRKWLEPELLKGSMEIVGLALIGEKLFKRLDGIEVMELEDILAKEYDYLIVLNQDPQMKEMGRRVLELLQVPLDKVIPVKVFGIPEFDLQRYLAVRESRISIIASSCWGGTHIILWVWSFYHRLSICSC